VLTEKYGTRVWTTADIADKLEYPEKFNYAALIYAYDKDLDGLKTDRILKHGEQIVWEGYHLTVDWMPGQTKFGLCVHGMIDGKKMAFTGDNIFGDPRDPRQNGHEALFARTNSILEEGYIVAADYLKEMDPDIIVGGHSFVMGNPRDMIRRYHQWAYDMRDTLQSLSFLDDCRYWYDPYWVRFESYRHTIKAGTVSKSNIIIRNFGKNRQAYHIQIHTPKGVRINPQMIHTFVEAESEIAIPVEYTVTGEASAGIQRQTLDVTFGEIRLGEWFDGILYIEK
jgi:glyoxylase-like metal-dependent hydrolase (beta-lactamase superfamily II)